MCERPLVTERVASICCGQLVQVPELTPYSVWRQLGDLNQLTTTSEVKFGTAERIIGLLCHTKFHLDRYMSLGSRPTKQ